MYILLKFNMIHFVDIRDFKFYIKRTFTVSPSKIGDARILFYIFSEWHFNKLYQNIFLSYIFSSFDIKKQDF